jgi:hypothetical protein
MTVVKEYTVDTYNVDSVSWSPYIDLIEGMGIAQLKIYYKANAADDSTYQLITKSSYSDTFISTAKTVNLTNATYYNGSAETVVGLNASTHDIKLVRETTVSYPYVTFQDGTKLSSEDLNKCNLQALHRIEEERFFSNAEDDALKLYVEQLHALQYLKTEIDEFFRTLTVPNWVADKEYKVGDTVLHNDPYDSADTLFVWYAGQDHESATTNQPTAIAGHLGQGIWTVVNPQNSLDNLRYLRKNPGLPTTDLNWNTIEPENAEAYGLIIKPKSGTPVSVDSFRLYDNTGSIAVRYSPTDDLFTTRGNTELRSLGKFTTQDDVELCNSPNKAAWVGKSNFSGTSAKPTFAICPAGTDNVFELYNTSNSLSAKMDYAGALVLYKNVLTDGIVQIGKELQILGSDGLIGNRAAVGGTTEWPMFVNRDVQVGKNDGADWDPTIKLLYNTGDITADGDVSCVDVTATGNVTATTTSTEIHGYDMKIENLKSKAVLGTDSSGKIIDAGSTPTLNKLIYSVTANPGSALSAGDVVYLNRDGTTYVWTKSIATSENTCAVAVVDSVTASGSNQDIDVVFAGLVSGYSSPDLVPGDWYFLSKTTAGGITNTLPTGVNDIVDPVGMAVTTSSLFVVPARPNKLTP